ncbi:MAG TPA: hypothetical protein PLT09_14065 [Deltaproteobacteria bacterium]|nr:hypothetical protein [Deltaproteobacteria bacterium]HPR54375.1 hypothetical protein [Deltaproteobacteria bacterium]HXK48568.1 hypothetical protein [Deltaproteobacteria bacterium]
MRSIGDVVAIHINNQPSVYARIEAIEADLKPRWYRVKFLFLGFPPQEVTWILRAEYLEGAHFTMKDVPMQILPLKKPGSPQTQSPAKTGASGAHVISMNRVRAIKDGEKRKDSSEEE